MFGTAWRADPGLLTACTAAALGYVLLSLAYPPGFRAIIDGATQHRGGAVVLGVIITVAALPGSWVLRLIGATRGSKLTDQANLRLGVIIGRLVNAAPFLEHFERPEYLAEIDTLRERRRALAAAPNQSLGLIRSGLLFAGAAVLLALVWPPLLVVPLLAAAPAWPTGGPGRSRNATTTTWPTRGGCWASCSRWPPPRHPPASCARSG